VHWCDVHVKLGGIWMQVVFWGRGGLKVVLELFEVGHIDGEAWRRLLRFSEGLKRSSCYPRILTYGHFKVVSFEAVPYFG
jgi:hypothetical protein